MATEVAAFLNRFVSSVSIAHDGDRQQRVATTQGIINRLVDTMSNLDPLFSHIYTRLGYTGSYYERLKINQADEFDFNLQLKLPFQKNQFQVQHRHFPPGFVKYKLLKPLDTLVDNASIYEEIFDEDLVYLSRVNINRWLQSVIDRALATDNFPQISRASHSAPATTLRIQFDNESSISVDVVPVIQLEHIPRSARRSVLILPLQERRSCIVPKPPPLHVQNDLDTELLFRVSLPEIEKSRTQKPGCFKPAIRLFKAIRDRYHWETSFPSFFIKTFFLWQWEKRPRDEFWAQDNRSIVFVKMLEEFIGVLSVGHLPHYFFPKFDLLFDMRESLLQAMVFAYRNVLENTSRHDTSTLEDMFLN